VTVATKLFHQWQDAWGWFSRTLPAAPQHMWRTYKEGKCCSTPSPRPCTHVPCCLYSRCGHVHTGVRWVCGTTCQVPPAHFMWCRGQLPLTLPPVIPRCQPQLPFCQDLAVIASYSLVMKVNRHPTLKVCCQPSCLLVTHPCLDQPCRRRCHAYAQSLHTTCLLRLKTCLDRQPSAVTPPEEPSDPQAEIQVSGPADQIHPLYCHM
jgi:hypothetical protein